MGEVRAIVGILKVDGTPCFVKSMQVSQSTQQNSDTINAVLALDGQPLPVDFWLTDGEIELEAFVSGGLLFTGSADNVKVDFEQRIVNVSGRDKSKGPIEKKSTETFKNKTSSDIVSEIAGRHGLKPVVDSTSDKAGKRQHIDHARITSEISEWTLIQQLADKEGKVAFVQKDELHFKELDDESLGAYTITYAPPTPGSHAWGTNHISVQVTRNMQAAKPTKVKVSTWHAKKKKAFHGNANIGGTGSGENDYYFEHPGLEQDQVDKIAKKRLREATRHELTVEFDAPGRAYVAPRMRLVLVGFGAASQSYFIDKVDHDISDSGYRMTGTAKNTSKSRGGKGAASGNSDTATSTVGEPSIVGSDQYNYAVNGAINSGGR